MIQHNSQSSSSTTPITSVLKRTNNTSNITPPPKNYSPNANLNRFNPSPPPPRITTPQQPIIHNNSNPNNILLENTKINNSNIVVKRKRNHRHSKSFDTVTTPSPTKYVYPQPPSFPTFYAMPVQPIPPLPQGIKGLYSTPCPPNYFPNPSHTVPQSSYPRYNASVSSLLPLQQQKDPSKPSTEIIAEGNCIIEDETGLKSSDINISTESRSSEHSGQKRRSIVTKLRHLVNKTDEYLTKSRLKELANKEKEEMDEILAYYKDDTPRKVSVIGLLPQSNEKKKQLDLEFSQLVSVTRSAFTHLAKEYSKLGIDVPTNRCVKPSKAPEETIPNLLSDTSYYLSLVESLTTNKTTEITQHNISSSTVLNVLKTMESVLLDDTDTNIILSHPSTSVNPCHNDEEKFYEEIVPKYLFMNNKDSDSLNTSTISTIEKRDFAQQVEVYTSSITIQTDDKSVEEVSLQTSPIGSSSIDVQTEEERVSTSVMDIQTEPISLAPPEKQAITTNTQTDCVERISISTMTDELPIEKSNGITTQDTTNDEEETDTTKKNGTKREKEDLSSSEEEEEEVKPKRKIRKHTNKKKQEEPVYYIQEVVKHDNIDGKHWFYVKWKGFSARYNSWVEEHDIIDKSLIRKYIKK